MSTKTNMTMSVMTDNQMMVYAVEAYLEENYEFRRNVVSGKTEYRHKDCEEWTILKACVRVPSSEEEGEWMKMGDVCDRITSQYPSVMVTTSLKVKIGQALKVLGCKSKHTTKGQSYQLVSLSA